jgi:hypothetical protein
MDSLQRQHDTAAHDAGMACERCRRPLVDASGVRASTPAGICDRCAGALEGDFGHRQPRLHDRPAGTLEEYTGQLMCSLYESRQVLLVLQKQVRHDGQLLGRVGQVLTAIRRQERILADIQRWMASAQE